MKWDKKYCFRLSINVANAYDECDVMPEDVCPSETEWNELSNDEQYQLLHDYADEYMSQNVEVYCVNCEDEDSDDEI